MTEQVHNHIAHHSPERVYYEQEQFWRAERYLACDLESRRLDAVLRCVPSGIESVLDVGTGNGSFLTVVEQQRREMRLVGLDRSQTAVRMRVCQAPALVGASERLPFRSKSFDLVCALEVIEHLPHGVYENSLAEIERVASRYILISVPYAERRTRVECPYCGCRFFSTYHLRSLDERVLKTLFRTFQLADIRTINTRVPRWHGLVRVQEMLSRTPAMPDTAICPQCSFSPADKSLPPRRAGAISAAVGRGARLARRVWPRVSAPRWVMGLYQRMMDAPAEYEKAETRVSPLLGGPA